MMFHVFEGQPFLGRGHAETCYRICSHWPAQGQPTRLYSPAALRPDPANVLAPALPGILPRKVRARIVSNRRALSFLRTRAERAGLRNLEPGDVLYAWPTTSATVLETAKRKGAFVVIEFINCHVAYAKNILDEECSRISIPPLHRISAKEISEEALRVSLADAIFAPGPFVAASINEYVSNPPKILKASYGAYLPKHPSLAERSSEQRRVRFLFVGTANVRKGAHRLIEAWRRCRFPVDAAELVLAGGVESIIRDRYLSPPPPGLQPLKFQSDVAAVYRSADVFVFPSLEEGGPQVTYEAAAFGLPLIVTPMGGGWIAEDRRNALVVPASDEASLADAMRELFEDADLRRRLGSNAAIDARRFEWRQVADERRRALLEAAT